MEVKFLLFTFLPLFAPFGSIKANRLARSGTSVNRGNFDNSALRPFGTVPPLTSHPGNPATLSPLRPFGTVPPPSRYRPSGGLGRPVTTPFPGHPNIYHRQSSLRILEPHAAGDNVIISEPVVTSPLIPTTTPRNGGGSSPRLYPSLAYFERNGNPRRGEEIATTVPNDPTMFGTDTKNRI